MAKSYWLINSNRSEVKRFMKNDKSIDGVFEYMVIDTGKILGGLGNKPPVMTNTVSVEIDLAREIYERLLSKGWRKIENVQTEKNCYIFSSELVDIINADGKLKAFADQILSVTKGDGYVKPSQEWLSGTITTDLIDLLNTTKRRKYLEQSGY